MRNDEAEAALYALLAERWTTTPLAWRNIEARDYADASLPLLPDGEADYVSVQVDIFGGETITVPGKCIRYAGQLVLGVCVQESTGTRQAKAYQSDLQGLVESTTVQSSAGTVRLSPLSNSVDYFTPNGWYVLEAVFPFHFERQLTPRTLSVEV